MTMTGAPAGLAACFNPLHPSSVALRAPPIGVESLASTHPSDPTGEKVGRRAGETPE